MPRVWMPLFVIFMWAAASINAAADRDDPKLVVPHTSDLAIKTRETNDLPQSTVQTNTLYFKGAWQRRERHLQFSSALPPQRTVRYTTITRCDERRTLELNDEAQLYGWLPLNFGRDVYWMRPWWRARRAPPAAGADVKITINTVDTGERRQVGSYSARHVITTTTTAPGPGATTPPSESVEDGWHIDLPPAGCWDAGKSGVFFATGSVARPGGAPDHMNVEFHGAGRRGFPIEETTTRRLGEHEPPFTSRVTLIEFSETVLDKSLFDVPAAYRPAVPRLLGRFDLTKPDTVANRLAGYWEDVTTLARGYFRF